MDTQSPARVRFSHSRLAALADCPRRYRYRYVDRIPEAFQSGEAFLGTLVHDALQWLYLEREGRRDRTADEVVDWYRSHGASRDASRVRVVQPGGTLQSLLAEGEDMLRRHHATTYREDRRETLAIEPRVELVVGGHAYHGYVDRLARDASGMLHVIDFKTGRSMPPGIAQAGLQVRGYGVAVLETHGGFEVGLTYEYLRHGRALTETFARSEAAAVADALASQIVAALEAERVGEYPARPSGLCRWCGYRDTCDASTFREVPGEASAGDVLGCPRCGSGLVLRAGSRYELVACVRYPDCGHSREVRARDREILVNPMRRVAAAAVTPQLPPDEADLDEPAGTEG